MQSTSQESIDASDPTPAERLAAPVWGLAALIAALGSWVLYRADLGVNFPLVIALGAIALLGLRAGRGGWRDAGILVPAGAALVLAVAVAVTTDVELEVLLILTVGWLAARAVLAAAGAPLAAAGRVKLLGVPFLASRLVASETAERVGDGVRSIGDGRHLAATRGLAWALPIVAAFFVLLAEAEPIFGAARTALVATLEDLSFLPRLAFFATLGCVALGTFGLAAGGRGREFEARAVRARVPNRTVTERTIILAAVVALFAVFLALELAHLFGDPGGRPGSGLTYADAVHRGFGELTLVVSLSALLVIALDRSALRGRGERRVRGLTWLLLAECLLMLVSAWHRLTAYEAAYGYTVWRVEVHLYMVFVATAIAFLLRETVGGVDPARLGRRTLGAAVAMLAFAAYWNVPAWVVERNITRSFTSHRLDAAYLVAGLGDDALPALERGLPRVESALQTDVLCWLHVGRTLGRYGGAPGEWYEWNFRRAAAAAARERLLRLPVQCPDPSAEP